MKKILTALVLLFSAAVYANAAEPFRMQTGTQVTPQETQTVKPTQQAKPTEQTKPVVIKQQPKSTTKSSCQDYTLNWRSWKANVHQQILALQKTTPRPKNVYFPSKVEYSFSVNQNGTVSNIKIKNLDINGYVSEYTETGKYFYNIIKRLNYSPSLKFLPNSNRITMKVNVASILQNNAAYMYLGGAPDSSDMETVTKCSYPASTNSTVQKPTNKNISTPKSTNQNTLTEYEETIAWNQWRANLANEILRLGKLKQENFKVTRYKTKVYYSFDVDKYKNISNIIVTVENLPNKNDTYKVITHFKTIINMMNHKPILQFVEGSQRTSVHVKNSMKWVKVGEATPTRASDYSDNERIKKYK